MAEMLQPALVLIVSTMAPAPAAGRLSLPNYAQRSKPGTVIIRAAMPAAGSSAQSRACYGPPGGSVLRMAGRRPQARRAAEEALERCQAKGTRCRPRRSGAFLASLGETSAA